MQNRFRILPGSKVDILLMFDACFRPSGLLGSPKCLSEDTFWKPDVLPHGGSRPLGHVLGAFRCHLGSKMPPSGAPGVIFPLQGDPAEPNWMTLGAIWIPFSNIFLSTTIHFYDMLQNQEPLENSGQKSRFLRP